MGGGGCRRGLGGVGRQLPLTDVGYPPLTPVSLEPSLVCPQPPLVTPHQCTILKDRHEPKKDIPVLKDAPVAVHGGTPQPKAACCLFRGP